jgi:outer membrane protein
MMRKSLMFKSMSFALLLAVVPFAAVAQTPTTVSATTPSATKVGVVNMMYVINASNAGQKEGLELQKRFEPKTAEKAAREKELQDLQKKIESGGNVMSDDARAQLEKDFQTKETSYKRFMEDLQADVNQQKQEVTAKLYDQVFKTVDKYAKANGYSLILDSSSQGNMAGTPMLLWGDGSVDITKQVLEAFNTDSGVPPQPKAAGTTTPRTNGTTTTPKTTTPTTPKPKTP